MDRPTMARGVMSEVRGAIARLPPGSGQTRQGSGLSPVIVTPRWNRIS